MKLRILALPVMLLMLVYSCNAQQAHGVQLTWMPVPNAGATYTVFRSAISGGSQTMVKSGIAVGSFSESLTSNQSACYTVVTNVPNFSDSKPSNEVCGTAGKDQAPSVTGLSAVFN